MTIPSDSSRLAVAKERLHNASEEDAIFQALCDGLWAKAHDDAACPPERTGSTTAWSEWVLSPSCPADARTAASRLVLGLLSSDEREGMSLRWQVYRHLPGTIVLRGADGESLSDRTLVAWLDNEEPWWSSPYGTVESIHASWLDRRKGARGQHPLTPLARAWLERPIPIEPFRPKRRASLPKLERIREQEARRLPGFPEGPSEPEQLVLPGIDIAPDLPCPSWILNLYDAMGGPKFTRGPAAPYALRLFVGAMLHLPVDARDSNWHTLRFPLLEVEAWLHPGGWDRSNRRKYWHRLPEALAFMAERMGWIQVNDLLINILRPTVIPTEPTGSLVEFAVRIPASAAYGHRLDWRRLCEYGKGSAALYRAYLAACAVMGQSAHNGQPVTKRIPAPVLGRDGKPIRHKGGRIVRGSELVPNPAARFVRDLTSADLARLVGFNPAVRVNRTRAQRAFERLAEDGVLVLDREGRGRTERFRLFGPEIEPDP